MSNDVEFEGHNAARDAMHVEFWSDHEFRLEMAEQAVCAVFEVIKAPRRDCPDFVTEAMKFELGGGLPADVIEALLVYGWRHNWPPAEAFAREAAVHDVEFFPDAWANEPIYRLLWRLVRSILMELASEPLGFDAPETAPRGGYRPQPDAFAKAPGIMDREGLVKPPARERKQAAQGKSPRKAPDDALKGAASDGADLAPKAPAGGKAKKRNWFGKK